MVGWDDIVLVGILLLPMVVVFLVSLMVRNSRKEPKSIAITNSLLLAPAGLAPILLFLSCFIDNPPSSLWALIAFISMNVFSLWFIAIASLASIVWRKTNNRKKTHIAQVAGLGVMAVFYLIIYFVLK